MSEPQQINEILPQVLLNIKNRCNRYRRRHGLPLLREGQKREDNIAHVSKLLGHSSIRVTEQHYQHFLPDFLDGRKEFLCDESETNPET